MRRRAEKRSAFRHFCCHTTKMAEYAALFRPTLIVGYTVIFQRPEELIAVEKI
jgi:hypothetical protein